MSSTLIPFKQSAQIGEPTGDTTDYVHQLLIEKFEWDNFLVGAIRPLVGLELMGDDKPKK